MKTLSFSNSSLRLSVIALLIYCLALSSCVQTPPVKQGDYALLISNYPILRINGEDIDAESDHRYKQDIKAGDKITEGPSDPKELMEIKGIRETQVYLVDEVQKVYRDQGVSIHDKHIELIVRQMTRRVAIQEAGDSDFLPGERVDAAAAESLTPAATDADAVRQHLGMGDAPRSGGRQVRGQPRDSGGRRFERRDGRRHLCPVFKQGRLARLPDRIFEMHSLKFDGAGPVGGPGGRSATDNLTVVRYNKFHDTFRLPSGGKRFRL